MENIPKWVLILVSSLLFSIIGYVANKSMEDINDLEERNNEIVQMIQELRIELKGFENATESLEIRIEMLKEQMARRTRQIQELERNRIPDMRTYQLPKFKPAE